MSENESQMAETDAHAVWRERRKFGTDVPNEPTDEFVVQAFAEGARSLWPDSRDPGWQVTFQRWLGRRLAAERAEALGVAAIYLDRVVDYWDGRPLTHHGAHIHADLLEARTNIRRDSEHNRPATPPAQPAAVHPDQSSEPTTEGVGK